MDKKEIEKILAELDAVNKELTEQKKSLMKALKYFNETNYRINKLRAKIRKYGKGIGENC